MKILAISTWFPFPPDNGSKARACNLLKHVGAAHTLDLLALSQSERDAKHIHEVRQFCRRVEAFPEPQFDPRQIRSWLGFLSPVPRYFQDHHCPELLALAKAWALEEQYDVVLAITLGAAPYACNLRIPFKILDQHNVESEVIKRQWRNEQSPLRRLRLAPTCLKAARFERAVASRFNTVAVVSEREKELMNRLLRNRRDQDIHVIPNGVSPDSLEYARVPKEPGVLAFTGALAYQPNHDAAVCLCREVLPLVWAEYPRAHARITGRIDAVDISDLAEAPGVEFTGYVDDIRPVVASASALVVPLRYGGGTRLKILEAMALGTPVISTPMGAEGLEVTSEVNILFGETAAELAEQTLRILKDANLAARISKNARELVRERYQWPAIAGRFESIFAGNRQEGSSERCSGAEAA